MKTNANEQGKIWLKKEMRPYRASILFLTCLAVLTTAFSILFAYVVRYLINSASDKQTEKLWYFAGVLLGLLLLKILFKVLRGYYTEKACAKMTAGLRTRLYGKILRSDYESVQQYHSGDLITRLTADINEVAGYSVNLLPAVVGMVIQCVGAVVALLTIDPLFTGIYVLAGATFAGITMLFRKHLKRLHKDVLSADAQSRAYMQEGISSVFTLKAYGAEGKSTDKAESFAQSYYQKRMKRNALRAFMSVVFSLLSNFGLIFAVVWCSVSILNGRSSDYGSMLSAILLLMQLQTPLSSFSSIPPAYYARIASGERLADIENITTETIQESGDAVALYEQMTGISFEKVAFSYGRESVLTDITAQINKGEIVCLTGPSGTGKSTIFKLLLQVYQQTAGEITLRLENGAQPLTAKERGLFAYVPQGNFLFSGTIYENLAFFSGEKNDTLLKEKMHSALKTACAEFVFDLPQGLDTVLCEGGEGLSEGQLQRLAVARALLSDRPILLLDESTSALDADTEKRLIENIAGLKNKTCILVTHRPKALEIADKVLRIEHGAICDVG